MIQTCFKRIEKKYLLNKAQYYAMLNGIENTMEPDRYSNYAISNVYYDTADFDLIRKSLEKPVYKEKLRIRSYGVPTLYDDVFVELKKKFDGVVYKRRITMNAADAEESLMRGYIDRSDQISREINWFLHCYHPVPMAYIGYDREAFAGLEDPNLRLTFDTNLRGRFRNVDLWDGDYGYSIIPKDTVLMEIKIPGSAPLWLSHLLSDNRIYDVSFSKYGTFYQQLIGAAPVCLETYQGELIYA
ncbi:MAG: polyphosphate polymerase domain-containing protein [Anaerolineaceae bacterium]|nr:polyphosphate polymerase domain-containing protein [Anaerolineaceae bacterium]